MCGIIKEDYLKFCLDFLFYKMPLIIMTSILHFEERLEQWVDFFWLFNYFFYQYLIKENVFEIFKKIKKLSGHVVDLTFVFLSRPFLFYCMTFITL